MTLREYLTALKSWLLLAGLVLGVIGAGTVTGLATPKYVSSTLLFVSAQGLQGDTTRAYQGSLLSTEKVKTYAVLITNDRIRTAVSDQLHTEIAPGQITAAAQPGTVLITATVTDTSPRRAQQIADAVGAEFVALLAQLEKPADDAEAPATVIARVVQPAPLPTHPISPRPTLNLAAGAGVGLLLGYTLALLRYARNTPPKLPEMQL